MSGTATLPNGKPQRKQLCDQIDRLDTLVDGLANALPEAVADACREGARQAVKDAVIEIVTNAELRQLIMNVAQSAADGVGDVPAKSAATPGPFDKLKAMLAAARGWAVGQANAVKQAAMNSVRKLRFILGLPLRRILFVSVCVGATCAGVSYACPHLLSALVSGVSGAFAAVTAQVTAAVSRVARNLGLT